MNPHVKKSLMGTYECLQFCCGLSQANLPNLLLGVSENPEEIPEHE
jgi:hypothetical protein